MDLKAEKVPYAIPVPNNMGMVRYVMAFSVLIAHFNSLGGASFYWPISSYNAVGGFFALSGFLMIGSWLRKPDFRRYFKSRCRRLLPAYWSVVLLFAVVLGLFSETPGYFLSSGFYEYLAANLSFLNFVHPGLPGVFTGMEVTAVNGSLWTMKVEWLLYLSLPCVAWFLVRFRRRPVLILGAVYLLSVAYRFLFLYLYNHSGREVYMILSRQFLGQMMFFYTGVFIYYYYGLFMRFRYVVLFLSSLLLFLSSQFYFLRIFIEPAAISSLVIWFSMVGRWRLSNNES